MDFTGKICPYCKTEFKEGDDIVVCSACEMPHHKECWIENKGCTTFGCTGTITGLEEYNDGLEGKLYCKRCGAVYAEGQAFCSSCGTKLTSDNVLENQFSNENKNYNFYKPNEDLMDSEEKDMRSFIKVEPTYYINCFKKLEKKHIPISWNWLAFLFNAFWFAYRKMYDIAVIFFLAGTLINYPVKLLTGSNCTVYILKFVYGFIANFCYMRHVKKHMERAKDMNATEKEEYFRKKGGTSVVAVIIAIVCAVIVNIAFYLYKF